MKQIYKWFFSVFLTLTIVASIIPSGFFKASAIIGDGNMLSADIDLEFGTLSGSVFTPLGFGTALKTNDVITVRICPKTDFYCGSTSFVVMFDKLYFSVVGSNKAAFTPNANNTFYNQTASGYSGTTDLPDSAWPLTMGEMENFNVYKAIRVGNQADSNSNNGGYPSLIPGTWLFQFKLKVLEDIDLGTEARVLMDKRWFRSPTNTNGTAYFAKCSSAAQLSSSGSSSTYNFDINLAGANINLSRILTSVLDSGCVIDGLNGRIYGVASGATSLVGYVNVASGYELSYIPTSNGFGTGTIANVTKDGEVVQDFKIIIYGDVNGDTNIDSIDAGTIVNVENDVIPWDPIANALYFEAGDLNGDGNVDSMDAGIAIDSENDILFINQSTGIASGIAAIEGTIVIKGLPKVGNTLTIDTSNITPMGATLTYMWKRSGGVVGTEKTYVVTNENIGKSITVTVTGFGGFTGGVRSAAVVAMPAIINGTAIAAGTAKFGEVLTADTSNIDTTAATYSYQWKRGEMNIGSESTYTIVVEDIGQPITVTVTGTGVYEGSITSEAVVPEKADVIAPMAPKISIKTVNSVTLIAVAGQEYKVEGGAWQSSIVFTGLNKNTAYNFYTRIAETATHNASGISTALSVTTTKVTITGTVLITGNASVGQTLSADISGVIPNEATLSYKWKAGTVQIGTESTYTVTDADIGESIAVTVTGTGDYTGSLTSMAVVIAE